MINSTPDHLQLLSSVEDDDLKRIVQSTDAEAFVCVNDKIAGRLMQTALGLGRRVPQDLRIVGIDDLGYSRLLPVRLTTITSHVGRSDKPRWQQCANASHIPIC